MVTSNDNWTNLIIITDELDSNWAKYSPVMHVAKRIAPDGHLGNMI